MKCFPSGRNHGQRCVECRFGSIFVTTAGAPPDGDMVRLAAKSTAFFEADASEERKQILRDNMARLPPNPTRGEVMYAQTPMRYFDPRFDAVPLYAEAVVRPEFLQHAFGSLTPGWDITVGASSLRVPLFLAHGRYDYTVPYVLWDGIPGKLPNATLEIFERSGHQPFFEEPARFVEAVTRWMKTHTIQGVCSS